MLRFKLNGSNTDWALWVDNTDGHYQYIPRKWHLCTVGHFDHCLRDWLRIRVHGLGPNAAPGLEGYSPPMPMPYSWEEGAEGLVGESTARRFGTIAGRRDPLTGHFVWDDAPTAEPSPAPAPPAAVAPPQR